MTTAKPTRILAIAGLSAADLPNRVRHLKLPITTVDTTPPAAG